MSFPTFSFPSYPAPADSPGVAEILAIVSNAGYGNSALETLLATVDTAVALIKAKTDLICAGQVTVEAPVDADGDAAIDQGYDYYAVDGRGLSWTDETPATWPDLSGATAEFVCGSLEVTCTITNPTGPATIAVDLSSTQTSSLAGGVHPFKIEVTLANGHLILQIRGELTVTV